MSIAKKSCRHDLAAQDDPSSSLCPAEGGVEGTTICDAGCGTGSLAIPLALRVRL